MQLRRIKVISWEPLGKISGSLEFTKAGSKLFETMGLRHLDSNLEEG